MTAEQIGEPELARLSIFQPRFLRMRFSIFQGLSCWSANPVTSNVELSREARRLVALRFSLVACRILFFCCARATYILASRFSPGGLALFAFLAPSIRSVPCFLRKPFVLVSGSISFAP